MTLARRVDLFLPLLAGAVSFVVYLFTLAPTITLDQAGHFIVAADYLGVSRHPGYPIWHLIAHGFTRMFRATFHGYPNPAWAVNLVSACFAALAVSLLTALLLRIFRPLLNPARLPDGTPVNLLRGAAAWTGAMQLAFNNTFWSQAVIAETHALTAAWFLLCCWTYARWIDTRSAASGWWAVVLTGLGPAISPILLLLVPVWIVASILANGRAGLGAVWVGMLYYLLIHSLFRWGRLDPRLFMPVIAVFLLIAAATFFHRASRSVGGFFLALCGGFLPYIYLPLAAARNPPINSGASYQWDGFWHVVGRGQYEKLAPFAIWREPERVLDQLKWLLDLACDQFTPALLSVALLPLLAWPWLDRLERRYLGLILTIVFFLGFAVLTGANLKLGVQTTLTARVLFLPLWAAIAALIGWGLALMLCGLTRVTCFRPGALPAQ